MAKRQFQTPNDLVRWMGALQAQDYEMAKWAMGVRLPGSTRQAIETAIERGEIIRTHLMRPTWHVVSAEDLRWMLKLTAPQIKTSMRSRHKQLGLNNEAVNLSNKIIENALAGGNQLTRKKLVGELEKAGFENTDNLASHLLLCAELEGIICSGATQGKEYTYALLDERVSAAGNVKPNREEALARLARTYFSSHGPATLEDFTWWSGLTLTEARRAIEMVRADFVSEEIGSQTYWFAGDMPQADRVEPQVYLLPAFDEFIISYKDRSAVIASEHHSKAFSRNGIFRPVILADGEVMGIWKRSVKKEHVLIGTAFFSKPTEEVKNKVEKAAGKFAAFLGKEPEIRHYMK